MREYLDHYHKGHNITGTQYFQTYQKYLNRYDKKRNKFYK